MDEQVDGPDQGTSEAEEGVWVASSQSAYVAEVSSAALASSSQDNHYVDSHQLAQDYANSGQYDHSHYQDLRPTFSGAYQINAATQQELFQAAHSTFGRITPLTQDSYHHQQDGAESEAMPAYSTIATDAGTQLIAAPTVDSSTLQQGYYVINQDNQVVAVQRVVSPADCTVSQSNISIGPEGREVQPNATLISMPAMSSSGQYVTMEVTSLPAFSSQGEVSTSSVGALRAVIHQAIARSSVPHDIKMEVTMGECDTTQEDLDCESHVGAQAFLHAVNLAGHTVGVESDGLHSTMISGPQAVAATVTSAVMDDTLDSSQLSTLQSVAMEAAGSRTLEEHGNVGSLNSSGISDSLSNSVVSAAESSSVGLGPSAYRAIVVEEAPSSDPEQSQPCSSGASQLQTSVPAIQTRKSTRLANFKQEELNSARNRQVYEPGPYNYDELWCEECQVAYQGECPTHHLTVVSDKVVLSRAWASLPNMLQIFRLGQPEESNQPTELGVFAKKAIPKMTQFGPLVGELVDSVDRITNRNFVLILEKPDQTISYFELSDENKCNWMMFVRPAASYSEQNLVAYQHGQDVFFSVIKNIEARQELKVWYAAHYADRMGMKPHELMEADWATLDEQASRFQCCECNRKFRTSMALQRHLLEHETEEPVAVEVNDIKDDKETKSGSGEGADSNNKAASARSGLLRNKARQGGDGFAYQWKKKPSSIYLNKSLKKYQRRPASERLRQTMKSLYKRKGHEGGNQEWVCTHCNLTFDNPSLLNLHTLTHAAEDVGLDEIRKITCDPIIPLGADASSGDDGASAAAGNGIGGNGADGDHNLVCLESCLVCPVCHSQFQNKRDLIEHVAEHAKAPRSQQDRPFKCHVCWKAFTAQEKLQRHLLCHGEERMKPLECHTCHKRFMNNSALACHLKTHSEKKYYECPMCHEGFDHIGLLKQHVNQHADENGIFKCRDCGKMFDDFNIIRKHIRSFHSEKQYPCSDCPRVFSRPDKLKLHMLRHTSHREFMCETCGRQFKRKDKLKEHTKRMHSAEREAWQLSRPQKPPSLKRFTPKVSPSEYHRFMYKCNHCLIGFKRRGMLVNHLAKRHPEVKLDSVPELTLPILKTQRDYFCQHCDKVYKSSSKRKAHYLKNHPGAQLPPSSRKKVMLEVTPGIPNQTFSQPVGSITTVPHGCSFCHKQYASKAKLMQHQRKSHPDLVPAISERRKPRSKEEFVTDLAVVPSEEGTSIAVEGYGDVVVAPGTSTDNLQAADLLTQAMSELTQSLQEFRPGSTNITVHAPDTIQLSRLVAAAASTGTPTLLQVQPNGTLQPTTIELTHLTQALGHAQFTTHPAQLNAGATLIAAAAAASQSPQQKVISQPVSISVVTNNGTTTIPVTIAGNQAFVPHTWASNFQTFQR